MVYMYHSFLIHSSADGHLGCFHVLAIINSAAMNIGVHMSQALYGMEFLNSAVWIKVYSILLNLLCDSCAYSSYLTTPGTDCGGCALVAKSCLTLATSWIVAHLCPQDFPGKNSGVGCHFLLLYLHLFSSKSRKTIQHSSQI